MNIAQESTPDGGPSQVDVELLVAPTVRSLVDLSKEAQMVVVGCRGEGAVGRALLGSVSTGLIHHAYCPVAVDSRRRSADVAPVDSAGTGGHRRLAGLGAGDCDRVRRSLAARWD
jgi:hypothetical protein